MYNNDEYLRCPRCGSIMILRERYSDGNLFYGCPNYPDCKGTRNLEEGNGKKTAEVHYTNNGDEGRCNRCGQYPAYGSLSSLGLCPGCQDDVDRD